MAGRVGTIGTVPPMALVGPLDSAALMRELPGLSQALDAPSMAPKLEDALLVDGSHGLSIASCAWRSPTYLHGDGFLLRYEIDIEQGANSQQRAIVNARLFQTSSAAVGHARRLRAIARLAGTHQALRPFARRVAVLDDLRMAVSPWPIDGGLPTLAAVTNEGAIMPVLARALERDIRSCTIHLGHYGRQHRCVVRYELELVGPDRGSESVTVYGKVAADERGAFAHAALTDLLDSAARAGFRVPRSLGYVPRMRLLLLEAIPGEATIGRLLKASVRGAEGSSREPLEQAMRSSARLLACLHTVGPARGVRRDYVAELEHVTREVVAVGRLSPPLGKRLEETLLEARTRLRSTDPLPLGFAHGDFRHSQILVDRDRVGVVDLDTVCRAEPALDVGHFVAYLRLALLKADPAARSVFTDDVTNRFLRAYVEAANLMPRDEARLRERAAAYELLSLVRLATHSWRKLKINRLGHIIHLIEERSRC
jgi:aminoglycoside phosphotransferase (APT) family kinase protein